MNMNTQIKRVIFTITANASGAGRADNELYGVLMGFHIDYGNAAAGTDVEIYEELENNAKRGLLTVTNANTSQYFAVQRASVSTTNASTGGFVFQPVAGRIVVSVTDAGNGSVVRVYAYIVP